ncbi:hypothetical protein BDZ97DRAFT_1756944 [Flammula alnicola]|nr:hypothetical protein BDZ97DRAFT_1756944 [Flammula alnicola]
MRPSPKETAIKPSRVKHLCTLLNFILSNSEVRKLLSDFSLIGGDLLAKGAAKAATFITESGHVAGPNETPVLEARLPGTDKTQASTARRPGDGGGPITDINEAESPEEIEEKKRGMMGRMRQIRDGISDRIPQRHKDDANDTFERGKHFLTEEYFPEDHRDPFILRSNSSTILRNTPSTVAPLPISARITPKSPRSEEWFSAVNLYIRKVLLDPGYVLEPDCNSHANRLRQSYDESTATTSARLTEDLLFGEEGSLKFKSNLWNDIPKVILPTLIDQLEVNNYAKFSRYSANTDNRRYRIELTKELGIADVLLGSEGLSTTIELVSMGKDPTSLFKIDGQLIAVRDRMEIAKNTQGQNRDVVKDLFTKNKENGFVKTAESKSQFKFVYSLCLWLSIIDRRYWYSSNNGFFDSLPEHVHPRVNGNCISFGRGGDARTTLSG